MAYITRDDMVARFGDKVLAWADDDDTAVMTAAIESASAEIDGYVASGGYTLPLATVPEILKVHACSIVAYRLLVRAGFFPDTMDAGQKPITQGYQHALHYLEKIARRTLRLAVKDGTPTTQNTCTSTMVRAAQKLDLGGFV